MQIKKWNVWHNYSSTVVGPIPPLAKWAEVAVRSQIAPLAIHRDGRCWYRSKGQLREAETGAAFVPNKAEGAFVFPHDVGAYEGECLLQAAEMRTHEQFALSDSLGHVPEYIRVYFEPCVLEYEQFVVRIYPQAKIYSDGVILIALRVLSGETPYQLEQFIEEQVNLYAHTAVATELPFNVLLGAALHGFCFDRSRLWRSDAGLRRSIKGKLRPLIQSNREGDFRFRRLRADGTFWEGLDSMDLAPYNLRALVNLYAWALLDSAATAERRWPAVVKWRSQRRLGNYWSGRPSIYVAETNLDVRKSEDLTRLHAKQLASILMRSTGPFTRAPKEGLGPNLREFEDYALFANRSVTLWFGLNNELFPATLRGSLRGDRRANCGDFVHTKHVLTEFIEYWYMAHKAAEERSLSSARKLSELAHRERELSALDRSLEETPRSGEIAALVRHVGNHLNVQGIAGQVRANLRYREVLMQEARDTRNLVFGSVLAVLLGLTGAADLADAVVQPLWSLLGWPTLGELESFACASILLVVSACVAAVLVYRFGKRH